MQAIEPFTGGKFNSIPIICGPTASRKSALALSLCETTGGELCSMDSMQIYRGMNIGTAKPTQEEQKRVPHHLIDLIDPTGNFSVAAYRDLALACIKDCLGRGHLPVFCGGTGQYASALAQGITYLPVDVVPSVHDGLLQEAADKGYAQLHAELALIDPESAEKIHPNNKKRVLRALEIYRQTGKTMTYFNEQSKKDGPQYPFALFAIDWDRETLYERMDFRVEQMMEAGLLAEVEYLQHIGMTSDNTAMQAIGYKELFSYLAGDSTLEEAVSLIKQKTRNYGKRQLTWFRNMGGVQWIRPSDLDAILEKIQNRLQDQANNYDL